jgi:hypothetical protein
MSVEPERDVTPPVHAQLTLNVTPVTAKWGGEGSGTASSDIPVSDSYDEV